MKIEIYKDTRFSDKENFIKLEFKGSGNKDDPIIIESTENLPDTFELHDLNEFIIIKNLKIDGLRIYASENINIENCTINDYLMLSGNSNIKIKNIECANIWMDLCDQCILENSFIPEFYISNSNDNVIRSCEINTFSYNNNCKGNIFKDNKLDKKNQEKLKLLNSIDHKPKDYGREFFMGQEGIPPTLKCNGIGLKSDPIIILPQKIYRERLRMCETVHYLVFKDFSFMYARFTGCKNKSTENCSFEHIGLLYCDNFNISDNTIKLLDIFGPCQKIVFHNISIKTLRVIDGFDGDIVFKNCTIEEFKRINFEGINFENSKVIKELDLKELKKILKLKEIEEKMLAIK